MTELEHKIEQAAQKYYTDGSSELTDAEFDALVDQLRSENPDSELLKTVGWGYKVSKDNTPGQKYIHKYGKAGSLDKAYNFDEINLMLTVSEVDISAKLDGLSVVLYYESGKLVQALTRGDGTFGIDITPKVMNIIDDKLQDNWFSGAIRGEIIMSYDNFKRFQELHPEAKNPRNSAAGLINNKQVSEDLRFVEIIPYSVVGIEPEVRTNHAAEFETIFAVRKFIARNFSKFVMGSRSRIYRESYLEDFSKYFEAWSAEYPIDGLVLTLPNVNLANNGEVKQDSQAFKFKSEVANSTVVDIEWNMSKTNYAIPRVKIEPVQLAGTTVQYCTGYNAQYISENNLGIGAVVEVEKRGEIIPNINKVIAVSNSCELPKFCPYCNCELRWEGVHLACKNPACANATTQDTMIWTNILAPVDNLGESLKEKFFVEAFGKVPSIEILMREKPSAYQTAPEGTQAYRMKQMFDKLFSKDKVDLVTAIKALNIPRFGDVTAAKLADYPKHVKRLIKIALDGSCADGVKAAKLFDKLSKLIGVANTESLEQNMDIVARLQFINVDWSENRTCDNNESKGKVAITGKLSVKRSEFEKELKAAGYVSSEISKDTKFLITDNPNSSSSKNKKADAWGIVKISEQQFRKEYM